MYHAILMRHQTLGPDHLVFSITARHASNLEALLPAQQDTLEITCSIDFTQTDQATS